MAGWLKGRNLVRVLLGGERDDHLARYVIGQHARGRALREILDDPYLRNRTTPAERERLLERPHVVAALGDHAVGELRRQLAGRSLPAREAAARTEQPAGSTRAG